MKAKLKWTREDKVSDLRSRHLVKICKDGRRRNALRALTKEERWERFLTRIEKHPSGCWMWKGSVCGSESVYGQTMREGQLMKAHRYAFETFYNTTIPAGLVARHMCDQPLCVNPEHVVIGTTKDNVDDKMRRGRHRWGVLRGEASPVAKITDCMVRAVMKLLNKGVIRREIAQRTGVSLPNVGAIVRGRSWRHVTGLKAPL